MRKANRWKENLDFQHGDTYLKSSTNLRQRPKEIQTILLHSNNDAFILLLLLLNEYFYLQVSFHFDYFAVF